MLTTQEATFTWLRRRLLALVAVAAVAAIYLGITIDLRTHHHPARASTTLAVPAAPAPASAGLAVEPFDRELILMEAAGLVTLARPEGTPPQTHRRVFPQELIQMEAAGLVTLAR
ncbi:MAG: hypothetical protein KIT87_17025 [Anaerolineae bacterium]|nr:hypothetical protein [Anaerolineae bacterium]